MSEHDAREHILICLAAGDRKIGDGAVNFAIEATNRNSIQGRFKFSVAVASGIRGYAQMRNTCVKEFLESPCSRLWFVDDDVIPPLDKRLCGNKDGVFQLLDVDADIAIAPYPFVGNFSPVYMHYEDPNTMEKMKQGEGEGPVLDVTGVGMGCTIIKRRVLEDRRMWYPTSYKGVENPPKIHDQTGETGALPPVFRFQFKPDGRALQGEDFDFCIRAKRLGYSIKFHSGLVCGHLKYVDILWARQLIESQLGQAKFNEVREALHVR